MRPLLAAAALSLLLTTPAAAAPPSVGNDGNGVLAQERRGDLVITFTRDAARRYRRIAGRTVEVRCTRIEPFGSSSVGTDLRAPRRRTPLRLEGETDGDYCSVRLRRRGRSREDVATVPLTRRGVRVLDERTTARNVIGLAFLSAITEKAPFTYPDLPAPIRRVVAPLPGPDTFPAGRALGYWSDGEQKVWAVQRTRTGRVFYFGYDFRTQDLRTNLLEYLTDDAEDG